jgi:MarR family transcriptional regulator, 2-MHQ and catechol-resistance regulon repressor
VPTRFRGASEEVLALDTFIKLTRAANAVSARLLRRRAMGDLTPTQFGVLESLYHLGPLSQTEIGAKLLKSGGNITLVIDNLEKRDLARRDRARSDRRLAMVSLTDKGRQLIDSLFPAHAAAIAEELAVLTPEEQRILGQLCRRVGRPDARPPDESDGPTVVE